MSRTRGKAAIWIVALGGAALVLAAFVLREPLGEWVRDRFGEAAAPPEVTPASPLEELSDELGEELVARLREAEELVDRIGRELVVDELDSARELSGELALALERAGSVAAVEAVSRTVEQAAGAARELGGASSLDAARMAFGEVNRALFHLAAHDEGLRRDLHVFRCPMAPGFDLWFQRSSSIANPYMGTDMPLCGVRIDWPSGPSGPGAGDAEPASAGSDETAYWTCSMHPSVKRNDPGTCPICAMGLTSVTVRERDEGLLFVDEHRRQLINLRTSTVRRGALVVAIRGYGEVTVAEPLRQAVNLRVAGWITELHADRTGQPIRAGESLFTLYSPELYSAQQEFLTTLNGRSEDLRRSAGERLRLLSLTEAQIDALVERGRAEATVEILAPRDGYLLAKHVIEGQRVPAGSTVMEIAGLDPVWIELEVFEGDLALVREGLRVALELSNVSGREFEATIDYVYPTLNRDGRAGRVRLVLPNADLGLRPGMHATARVELDLGERLLVPREAVVYTGPRRIVFLDVGEGRLLPREIEVGHGTPTQLEVLSGLSEGDEVVSSGTFLIASESRFRSAETIWRSDDEGE